MVKKFTLSPLSLNTALFYKNAVRYLFCALLLLVVVQSKAQIVSIENAVTVMEGNSGTSNSLVFKINIAPVSATDVTVTYDFSASTAIPGIDFDNAVTSITIPANTSSVTVSIPIKGDIIDEPNEDIKVNLTGTTGTASIIAAPANSAIGTITDDDKKPVVTISSPAQFKEANGVINFPVNLSNPSSVDLVLNFSYSGTAFGGASAGPGVDYKNSMTSIIIPAGNSSAIIPVIVFGDVRDENTETIIITLNSVSLAAVLGSTAASRRATVQVLDTDAPPTVAFEQISSFYTEGIGTAVTVRVTLTGNITERTVRVPYSISGTALESPASNYDFQITSGASQLVFNREDPFTMTPGQRVMDITLIITSDNLVEPNETVVFSLETPLNSSAILGSNRVHTLTIVNDDTQISVAPQASSMAEGTGGGVTDFTFVVKRDGDTPLNQPINFTYSVSPSGSTSADAGDFPSGFPTNVSGTIPAGQSSVLISIPVNKDSNTEPIEEFMVKITPESGVVIGADSAQGVIQNDDNAVNLVFDKTTIDEGQNATIYAQVQSPFPIDVTVTVAINNLSGSAIRGIDYNIISGTLTFIIPKGSTQSNSINLSAVKDNSFEGTLPETVIATITSAANATAGAGAILQIRDLQSAPLVSISTDNLKINEVGSPNVATITVSLSNPTNEPVKVNLSLIGTAQLGVDYSANNQSVVIPIGASSASVTVAAINDGFFEGLPNETINVGILSVQGGGSIQNTVNNKLTIEIVDTNSPPVVRINDAPTVIEGSLGEIRYLQFPITLSRQSTKDIILNYSFSGTATGVTDYDNSVTQLKIEAGKVSGVILIPVLGDNIAETPALETVVISLLSGTDYTLAAAPDNVATGIIIDDDGMPTVSLTIDYTSIREPGTHSQPTAAKIRARLANSSQTSASDITVTVNLSGSAVNGTDYATISSPVTLVIPAGLTESSIAVTVSALADNIFEFYDETVQADLTSLSSNAQAGLTTTQLAILDNDSAPLLTIDDPPSVIEGNTGTKVITFNITKTTTIPTLRDIKVNYVILPGTATATDSDYENIVSNSVIIPAGQSGATVNVTINGDSKYEADETFTVSLQNAQFANLGAKRSGVGTIVNDDNQPVISIGDVEVNENAGTVTLTLNKTGMTELNAEVNYETSNGTATALNDYTSIPSIKITFLPEETSKTIKVPIVNDLIPEPNEIFNVILTNPVGATIGKANGIVTIIDDDISKFYIKNDSINENSGTIKYRVYKLGNSPGSVTYQITDGSAKQESDFKAANYTAVLDFADNESYKDITVNIVDDAIDEPNEDFIINLSNPSVGSSIIPGLDKAVVAIIDNDTLIAPSIDLAVYKIVENKEVKVDEEFNYTITAANLSNVTVDSIAVRDSLPEGLEFISAVALKGAISYDPVTHKLFWAIDSLQKGEEQSLTLRVKVNQAGIYINTASVSTRLVDKNLKNNTASASKLINGFAIPNVFTPNNDGVNDYFVIKGIESIGAELTVYNRFGQLMFKAANYQNDWDGNLLPIATYYYVISMKNEHNSVQQIIGHVTILR
ncbi:Calx-beta domain-containing protein [Solitalea lacus]|uniref:Calx-beta domain-containing protein n=1 Tax=Solitalea lacus TaxID=2911172 RepID=UPI001EDB6F17|nr:Calx-beta domain-containing protein [Solitalea lacus]UKJ06463.1 gliding motility-associated C-terminal domain-containing protein [Solitalea lacus]